MKRLFYDQSTGEIIYQYSINVAPNLDLPYIDTDNDSLRVCDWLVDVNTMTLMPNPSPPQPSRR